MAVEAPSHEVLSWRLSTFRPSDREELHKFFATADGNITVINAVKTFVVGWEQSDWLEAYSIERIGKWLGKNAPTPVTSALAIWCGESAHEARVALRVGLRLGQP